MPTRKRKQTPVKAAPSKTPVRAQPQPVVSEPDACVFPLEIIDHILAHRFAQPDDSPEPNGKALSLVSHAWSKRVQRYLFESITLSVEQLEQFIDATGAWGTSAPLRGFVRELFLTEETRHHMGFNLAGLLGILSKLPSLHRLDFYLYEDANPGIDTPRHSLPNLTTLVINTDETPMWLSTFKHILKAAPNLNSLTITGELVDISDDTKIKPLIRLPNLKFLSLGDYDLYARLDLVLAEETLDQIVNFEACFEILDMEEMDRVLPPWLKRKGPNLQSLMLPHCENPESAQKIVDACPNLLQLVLKNSTSFLTVPSSVAVVRYELYNDEDNWRRSPVEYEVSEDHLSNWEGVKQVLVYCDEEADYVQGSFPDGVDVYVNNELYEFAEDDESESDSEGGSDGDSSERRSKQFRGEGKL